MILPILDYIMQRTILKLESRIKILILNFVLTGIIVPK